MVVKYHVFSRPVIDARNTTVTMTMKKGDRTYEIQFLPTVSLSIWLGEKEAKQKGSNHKIFGTLEVNDDKAFMDLWNAINDVLKAR